MPKAWITDLWTKDTIVNGERVSPTATQLRKLRSLPEEFRTSRFDKGNRWRVSWDDPQTSKRKTRSFATKADAEELKASLEDDIRSGRYIDPSNGDKLFKTAAERWLESKRKLKGATIWRYRRDLDRWVLPQWGHKPISSITRDAIDDWVGQLIEGTATITDDAERIHKGGLAPKTIHGIVSIAFGAPLRFAVQEGWLAKSPLQNVELPPEDLPEDMEFLNHKEIEALAKAVQAVPNPKRARKETEGLTSFVLVQTLTYTCLRINEALALDWGRDVNLRKKRIKVNRTWTVDREGKKTLDYPKTWERREVPIPDFLIPLLKSIESPGWVFKASRGGAMDDKNWRNRVWSPATKAIGLDGFKIHGLRHTGISLAIAAGADVKLIQRMAGHKSASITLDVYGHLWPDRLDEVADALTRQRRRALISAVPPIPNGYSEQIGS
ncbi:tyrosine-type recombinase/integrase [Gulosibacter molinativorax]|nr:site-specific integrase [Gulosibacter molinativorax]QUY60842.1 Putative tyrosine recombinase [Gulosibacter molinativorax]